MTINTVVETKTEANRVTARGKMHNMKVVGIIPKMQKVLLPQRAEQTKGVSVNTDS